MANLTCNSKIDEKLGTIYKDIAERDYSSMKNEMMKSIIRRVKGSGIIMGETCCNKQTGGKRTDCEESYINGNPL